MITLNPQPALEIQSSLLDHAVAGPVEENRNGATLAAPEMDLAAFDDLLEDLPDDFNGILVY